jgi:hypothetical protein
MSDVLIAPDDDLFWPPSDRTEAEAPEVENSADAWMYRFLGSRVRAFSPCADRVVVVRRRTPALDPWALGASLVSMLGTASMLSPASAAWDAQVPWTTSTAMWVTAPNGAEDLHSAINPPAEEDLDESERTTTVDYAVGEIKKILGLSDTAIEHATGVSRTTLWRLRSGRTSDARLETERPVWRLHAVALAARAALDDGVRSWLHAGSPSPLSLLESGDIAQVEQTLARTLFADPATQSHSSASDDDYRPAPHAATLFTDGGTAPKQPRRAMRAPRPAT